MTKVLILTDGKAGHENQSRAFAGALGRGCEIAAVRFKSKFHKALSYCFDRLGVRSEALWEFAPGTFSGAGRPPAGFKPAAVLGTGSGTFYAAKTLAKRLGVKCGVVLHPRGYDLASFDCILAPSFDNPPRRGNIVETPANLVAVDPAFYEAGAAAFTARHAPSARPAVAVVVGGPNKCAALEPGWLKAELARVFAETTDCEHWVTTSRRTPPAAERVVEDFSWDYSLIYSRDRFNPVPAFVKLAKRLYVTADSTGMLSEACTCGAAEVVALDNLKPGPSKYRRFLVNLRRGGYVDGSRKIDISGEIERAKELLGL
ncbi:MAG: mitochondrial fission ELM1 family protein [Kiritimatiellae bacterium]|nr:mitochondrial fission ELM1 family protein [Kiritimatiellia bacterium]